VSARSELAERIAAFVCEHSICQVYGGDVERCGRYYSIGISQCRNLDGEIRVYGPKFIQVAFECRYHNLPQHDSRVFTSEADALKFLRLGFVEYSDQAMDVPVKAPKGAE
jgi:hypothetical protein